MIFMCVSSGTKFAVRPFPFVASFIHLNAQGHLNDIHVCFKQDQVYSSMNTCKAAEGIV